MMTEDEGIKCLKVGDGGSFCFSKKDVPGGDDLIPLLFSTVFRDWLDFYGCARDAKWPSSKVMVYANLHSKAFGLIPVGDAAKILVEFDERVVLEKRNDLVGHYLVLRAENIQLRAEKRDLQLALVDGKDDDIVGIGQNYCPRKRKEDCVC